MTSATADKVPAYKPKSAPRRANVRGHDPRSSPLSESENIPYGYCQCGCGEKTSLATRSNPRLGHVIGEPVRFRPGHQGRRPLTERFWEKVDRRGPEECWEWKGATDQGYGHIWVAEKRRSVTAHRVAYELTVGEVAPGLHVDHLCRNRRCVNPAHLEPVTPEVNVLRGVGPAAVNARRTHCKHGHEFTPENTFYVPSRPGGRRCLECDRVGSRRRRARAKAQAVLALLEEADDE